MSKKEKMFDLVNRWFDSGLSKGVFCKNHDIKPNTFSYWVSKKRKEEAEQRSGFTHLEPPACASDYEITYPNGVKLHV